jgi:hypothetical protein
MPRPYYSDFDEDEVPTVGGRRRVRDQYGATWHLGQQPGQLVGMGQVGQQVGVGRMAGTDPRDRRRIAPPEMPMQQAALAALQQRAQAMQAPQQAIVPTVGPRRGGAYIPGPAGQAMSAIAPAMLGSMQSMDEAPPGGDPMMSRVRQRLTQERPAFSGRDRFGNLDSASEGILQKDYSTLSPAETNIIRSDPSMREEFRRRQQERFGVQQPTAEDYARAQTAITPREIDGQQRMNDIRDDSVNRANRYRQQVDPTFTDTQLTKDDLSARMAQRRRDRMQTERNRIAQQEGLAEPGETVDSQTLQTRRAVAETQARRERIAERQEARHAGVSVRQLREMKLNEALARGQLDIEMFRAGQGDPAVARDQARQRHDMIRDQAKALDEQATAAETAGNSELAGQLRSQAAALRAGTGGQDKTQPSSLPYVTDGKFEDRFGRQLPINKSDLSTYENVIRTGKALTNEISRVGSILTTDDDVRAHKAIDERIGELGSMVIAIQDPAIRADIADQVAELFEKGARDIHDATGDESTRGQRSGAATQRRKDFVAAMRRAAETARRQAKRGASKRTSA